MPMLPKLRITLICCSSRFFFAVFCASLTILVFTDENFCLYNLVGRKRQDIMTIIRLSLCATTDSELLLVFKAGWVEQLKNLITGNT